MTNAERIAQVGVAELAKLCFERCTAERCSCWECPMIPICKGLMFGKTAEQWREWLEEEVKTA